MSNHLREPEAWREIARRIAEDQWEGFGLCHEALVLRWGKRIHGFTEAEMRRRIRYHLNRPIRSDPDGSEMWAYPYGTEPEARILAALWLALEAEEEETP